MSAEVFVFQECGIRLTDCIGDQDWDGYYYADWGHFPDSAPTAWERGMVGTATAYIADGSLFMDTALRNAEGTGTATLWFRRRPSGMVNACGYTVEFRMACGNLVGPLASQSSLLFEDEVWRENVHMGGGDVYLEYAGSSIQLMDTDRIHLFRVEVLGGDLDLFIDNRRALSVSMTSAATGSSYCTFGDVSQDPANNALTQWSFVRYKLGAPPYAEVLDLGDALVRNVAVAKRPRDVSRAPNFASIRSETRTRGWDKTVTLSGDVLRLADFRDLAPNRDYRLEINGYNPATSQRESLTCERCRLVETRWGLADNGFLGHGVSFTVDGRIY